MNTSPSKRSARGSALGLMLQALLGMGLSMPVMVWLVGLAKTRIAWLAEIPTAWLIAPFLVVALAWLWFHRSPDNTHFTRVLK